MINILAHKDGVECYFGPLPLKLKEFNGDTPYPVFSSPEVTVGVAPGLTLEEANALSAKFLKENEND